MVSAPPSTQKRLEKGQVAEAGEQNCADAAHGLQREALPSGSST